MITYTLTAHQLEKLLEDVIGLRQEYLEQHGKSEEVAAICAVREVLEGLDEAAEMQNRGISTLALVRRTVDDVEFVSLSDIQLPVEGK